jgi:uncharacterized protein
VDLSRKRIALTMRLDEQPGESNRRSSAPREQNERRPAQAQKPRGRDNASSAGNSAMSDALAAALGKKH